jgi:hypothetical protein
MHCRIQKKYEFQNLDSFHGTAAFNLTKYPAWDSILTDMIFQPPDVVIISAKRRGRGHGGWSKDNPYLEEVRSCACALASVFHSAHQHCRWNWHCTQKLTGLYNIYW